MNGTTRLMLGTGDAKDATRLARAAGLIATRGRIVAKGVASRGGGTNWGVEVFVEMDAPSDQSLYAISSVIPVEHAGNWDDAACVLTTTIGEALQLGARLGVSARVKSAIQAVRDADDATGRRKAFLDARRLDDKASMDTADANVGTLDLSPFAEEILSGVATLVGSATTQDEILTAFFEGYESDAPRRAA